MVGLSQYQDLDGGGIRSGVPASPCVVEAERRGTQGVSSAGADDVDESALPDDLMELVRNGVTRSRDRSRMFMGVVAGLKELGFTVEGVYRLLARYPGRNCSEVLAAQGPAAARGRARLRQDDAGQPSPGAAAPPVSAPLRLRPCRRPWASPLADAHAVFKKWLGATYDLAIFDATASAGAAEKLGGDPLWLIVISGSGNAKTETVQSLSGAGAHVTSTITSEGALLSATTRSRGATGGLLHKIGARGLLVIKDLTSILAMDSNVRGSVLAAFREIHDGRWERNVGFAGGRTLTWTGRIVVVAACTTAWDEARKVIESDGRSLCSRAQQFDDRPGGIRAQGDCEHREGGCHARRVGGGHGGSHRQR